MDVDIAAGLLLFRNRVAELSVTSVLFKAETTAAGPLAFRSLVEGDDVKGAGERLRIEGEEVERVIKVLLADAWALEILELRRSLELDRLR